jgi:CheY-like chemotaxis protein
MQRLLPAVSRPLAARDGSASSQGVRQSSSGNNPVRRPRAGWQRLYGSVRKGTQVRDNLDRSRGGLGIGLALVKQLVELHGGSIAAESAGPRKGSAFRLRLPTAEAAPATVGAAESPSALSRQEARLKVLVVDDNFDVAHTMGWMIEAIGHDYRLVYDSNRAVHAAREYRPDAILLDINMPGMDGYAVCRALREQALFDDTVIIAQTGWGKTQDGASTGESGFDSHLVKPVNMDRLEQVLTGILSARRIKVTSVPDG